MKPYIFKYKDLDPLKLAPIGDRYLVEVLETDEQTAGGILLLERTEQERGWTIGVVYSIGNGHRLETADTPVMMPESKTSDSFRGYAVPYVGENSVVVRAFAQVPMFFRPGEVIFIEKYSGREFHIGDRTFRFVSQVDCLGTTGKFLVLQEDGGWEEGEPPAPATAPAPEPATA